MSSSILINNRARRITLDVSILTYFVILTRFYQALNNLDFVKCCYRFRSFLFLVIATISREICGYRGVTIESRVINAVIAGNNIGMTIATYALHIIVVVIVIVIIGVVVIVIVVVVVVVACPAHPLRRTLFLFSSRAFSLRFQDEHLRLR